MWNSNKSNIYSEDLPIVMTNRMCFSSLTRYALYDSTMHSPRRTHVKTSMSPLDLERIHLGVPVTPPQPRIVWLDARRTGHGTGRAIVA
jgi:hypothetical protein